MSDGVAATDRESRIVVIAPDSFKGTAAAPEVAKAIAAGWMSVRPKDDVRLVPMADGGEGTIDAFEVAVPGSRRIPVTVTGPDDRSASTQWLLLPDGTGVIELANTSGITMLDPLAPFDAHTRGFGEAIDAALDHGVTQLLLAIGGSASTDGGVGALTALGGEFLDAAGASIAAGNRGLLTLEDVSLTGLRRLPEHGALILSDVTNPLLGPLGAATIFGPQKGASESDVASLEQGLERLACLVQTDHETPGAGAAGGTGFGMLAWGAALAPGSAAVGGALGLPWLVSAASVVITGEGRFDSQSADGKVPSYLLELATAAGAPALLVAGRIEAEPTGFRAAESLSDLAGSTRAAIDDPLRWLAEAGRRLAATF